MLCYFYSVWSVLSLLFFFFFFNDTATTEIYTLSLHDALPICSCARWPAASAGSPRPPVDRCRDRKSTRLNSSHTIISYAVFCLKKTRKADSRKPRPSRGSSRPRTNTNVAGGERGLRDNIALAWGAVGGVGQALFFFFLNYGPPPDPPLLPPPAPFPV